MTHREEFLISAQGALIPKSDLARHKLAKRAGESVLMPLPKRSRSLPYHRRAWAMLNAAVDAGAPFATAEALLVALKVRLGLYDLVVDAVIGRVIYMPKSTDFSSMGQDEFQAFFDRAIDLICRDYLHGASVEAFLNEFEGQRLQEVGK